MTSVLALCHAQRHDKSPPTEGKAAGQGWISSWEDFPKKGTLPVHPPQAFQRFLDSIPKWTNLTVQQKTVRR
jgi:hypothetical protein